MGATSSFTSSPEGSRRPTLGRTGSFDLGYDPRIEAVWANVQRAAWVVMIVLIIAGLAGVFGRGPLATASVTTPDRLVSWRYDRFERFRTPSVAALTIAPDLAGRTLVVRLTGSFATKAPIVSVLPRTVVQRADAGGIDLVVDRALAVPTTIMIDVQPAHVGSFGGTLQIAGEPPLTFGGFIYP